MSNYELFMSPSNVFSGIQTPFETADYVIVGVPFDITSTYRTGARFGPTGIRQASLNVETFNLRTGLDIEDIKIHDLGDLHVSSEASKTLERLELVVNDILRHRKIPVIIGGEHTITYGVMKALRKEAASTAVISFDAHLDLRDEYMDLKMSHTTFMRRIWEEVKPGKIVEVGTRAVCKEEVAYAKTNDIEFYTSDDVHQLGSHAVVEQLKKRLAEFKRIYISVDMDVLDPAYVPAAQNPEAGGLETHTLLEILDGLCDKRVVGFDALEIAPQYDQGISAVQAAKVIFQLLCSVERSRKLR